MFDHYDCYYQIIGLLDEVCGKLAPEILHETPGVIRRLMAVLRQSTSQHILQVIRNIYTESDVSQYKSIPYKKL